MRRRKIGEVKIDGVTRPLWIYFFMGKLNDKLMFCVYFTTRNRLKKRSLPFKETLKSVQSVKDLYYKYYLVAELEKSKEIIQRLKNFKEISIEREDFDQIMVEMMVDKI